MDDAHSEPGRPAPWRLSFLILTLLLLTAVVALAIALFLLQGEYSSLQAENKVLHEERGTLVVDDPRRACAIRIPDRFAGPDSRAFRIYIPPGQAYLAVVKINEIPKSGIPEIGEIPDRGAQPAPFKHHDLLLARLEPGEQTLTLGASYRDNRRDYVLTKRWADLDDLSLEVFAETPEDDWPTAAPRNSRLIRSGIEKATTPVDATGRLVLLRTRVQATDGGEGIGSLIEPESDEDLDGVMIWLVQIR
jgi:hypothetical protein